MKSDQQGVSIREEIDKAGGVRVVADRMGVSPQAIYPYYHGRYEPTARLLQQLGLERVIIYRCLRRNSPSRQG